MYIRHKETGRTYWLEETSAPHGAYVETVSSAPQPAPAPQPQPPQRREPDVLERWEAAQRESRLSYTMDRLRREAAAASAPKPVAKPAEAPKTRVINPWHPVV